MINLVALFLMLLIVGAVIVLQIFLSRTESKVPGLILPILSFGFSLLIVLSVASWVSPGDQSTYTIEESVEVEEYDEAEEAVSVDEGVFIFGSDMEEDTNQTSDLADGIISVVIISLVSNVPTVVLSIIYFMTRKQMNTHKKMDRTRIQDL